MESWGTTAGAHEHREKKVQRGVLSEKVLAPDAHFLFLMLNLTAMNAFRVT